MSSPTNTLSRELSKRLRGNPQDSVANFAKISYENEVEDQGVAPAIAASRWLDWLSGRSSK